MKRRLALALLLSALMLAAAQSEPLSGWFAKSASAGMYEPIRGELSSMLADAGERGVPLDLMMTRIAEGAEKRVPPGKLVLALRKDLDNFALVISMVVRTVPGAASTKEWPDLLARGGMALRSGMDTSTFENVLAASAAKGVETRRAIDALIAVAAVDSRLPLGGEGKRALALGLASSTEKEARFSLLSSLFLRGKSGKLGTRDLVAIAVSTLDSGGGFLQLENEITRRLK